ncbi:unnamed protein product [Allacma fusca]|uniref:CRAL-TRIO domain-containing protein n=1 Tax=Allacma fusca TaxID=39272 RepID=A0A8J2PM01_9HEXA|nr:unnamed protein product [Allacma fusca]
MNAPWQVLQGIAELAYYLSMDGRARTAAEIAIANLRTKILDLQLEDGMIMDDLYLLRWLKARGMDPDKAERMLRRALKWREEDNAKGLRDIKVHPELHETFSLIKRRTRTGEPVYFVNPYIDLQKLLDQFGMEDAYIRVKQTILDAEEANIKWNKEVFENQGSDVITEETIKGNTLVLDWKNVSFRQVSSIICFKFLKQLAMDYLKYFPGLGAALILVNCPRLALHVVNVFKPLIVSPYLTIEVYDSNEEKWKPQLLKRIHPDELLVQYGGTSRNQWETKRGDI